MKTRKVFLMLAVAGLVYGCSKDEVVDPVNKNDARAISFRLQGSMPAPRATSIGIEQVNTFVVNGSETKDKASLATDYQWNLFNAVTVYRVEDKASGNNEFDYNPKKYYSPGTAYSQFVAYSPQTKNVTKGLASNSKNTISYKAPQPDPALAATGSKTTQEDFLVSFATGTPGVSNPDVVQLAFQHALARVFVSATNNTSEDVIIKELTLKNLYMSGDLKLDESAKFKTTDPGTNPYPATSAVDIMEGLNTVTAVTASSNLKILWENQSDVADLSYVLPLSGVAVPRRTALTSPVFITSKEQGMMVLPQLTKWNYSSKIPAKLVVKKGTTPALETGIFYLKVAYVHANLDNELYIPINIKTLYTNFTAASTGDDVKEGIAFEFGRQYNFVINFTANEINFSATVEDWSDAVGGSVYP